MKNGERDGRHRGPTVRRAADGDGGGSAGEIELSQAVLAQYPGTTAFEHGTFARQPSLSAIMERSP